MPDSVEMPAPVNATIRLAEPIMSRSRSISLMAYLLTHDHGTGMAAPVRRLG